MSQRGSPTTSAQCAEGARLASENAERLMAAAISLEREGHYGPAVAIYAAAAEEGAKSLALTLASTSSSGDLTPAVAKLLHEVTKDHPTKHAFANAATGPSTMIWFWVTVMLYGLAKQEAMLASVPAAIRDPRVFKESWFAKAPDVREAGLYVDLVNGAWTSPTVIDAVSAAEAHAAVEGLLTDVIRRLAHSAK